MVLKNLVESPIFDRVILALILVNAAILGLETSKTAMSYAGPLLIWLDRILLSIFTVEVLLRVVVYRSRFWRDPWRVFDLLIVGIALVPATGNLSVLRTLRVLRVLRVVGMMPSLRRVVGGLIAALPGMGSITLLLGLMFYVFSVMATKLFGQVFPQWFGTLGESAYTLFQIMTLESWSMGIVRPVLEAFPLAWIFFITFIITTSFTVLNLFIGIIVSAMQAEHEDEASEERQGLRDSQQKILQELGELRALVEKHQLPTAPSDPSRDG
ncbi:MAG: ion transporter [Pseudomonadota bacterium]